jgi:hypothetical protein
MNVPSYQMHNVLNVYSKQLKQTVSSRRDDNTAERKLIDQVNLSAGSKRQATIEKVSRDILNKITRFGSAAETSRATVEDAGMSKQNESPANEEHETKFVFNAIDSINQKTRNMLSVEDSGFLIRKLEQLAKVSGNQKNGIAGLTTAGSFKR